MNFLHRANERKEANTANHALSLSLYVAPVLQLMALVASTLLDLVKNLRAFAGILVVSDVSVCGSADVL